MTYKEFKAKIYECKKDLKRCNWRQLDIFKGIIVKLFKENPQHMLSYEKDTGMITCILSKG